MSPERRRLALRASTAALRIRQKAQIAPHQPCNVFDLADGLGVEVRFAPLPSAEGVYSPGKPVIIVSSLRPVGRQAFTCAHELGHHAYGHGEQFDELIEERGKKRRFDSEEFEADSFASALLMPRTAILKGLRERGWNSKTLLPEQAYVLASWLGVGYGTLISNMQWGMGFLTPHQAAALEKVRLPQIRKSILGQECRDHLVVVDEAWSGRAIDVQIGDLILLPKGEIEGAVVQPVHAFSTGCLVRAIRPGVGRTVSSNRNWAQFIRVSRKQYTGLARFRHLEEVDDE